MIGGEVFFAGDGDDSALTALSASDGFSRSADVLGDSSFLIFVGVSLLCAGDLLLVFFADFSFGDDFFGDFSLGDDFFVDFFAAGVFCFLVSGVVFSIFIGDVSNFSFLPGGDLQNRKKNN